MTAMYREADPFSVSHAPKKCGCKLTGMVVCVYVLAKRREIDY